MKNTTPSIPKLKSIIILCFTILCFAWIPTQLNAQTTVTVTDGNAPNLDIPIDCYYNFSYSEQIFLQSEINLSGDIIDCVDVSSSN